MIKSFFKTLIPTKYHRFLWSYVNKLTDGYAQKSYSQEGEDLLLKLLLGNRIKRKGFYVDVGAHHPYRFSNTYLFYKMGWRGINIDAMPGSMKLFNIFRKRDINLECAISNHAAEMTYFIFDEPAINTFSESMAQEYINNGRQLIEKKNIKMLPLRSILDRYLPKGTHIDFMSVDVEGMDLSALESNDWDKYKPNIILVEDIDFSMQCCNDSDLYRYLTKLGYELISKTFNTLFFRIKP